MNARQWLDAQDDPDIVGQSEYRAISDTLRDAINSLDYDAESGGRDTPTDLEEAQLLAAMLEEFSLIAASMRADLRLRVPGASVLPRRHG